MFTKRDVYKRGVFIEKMKLKDKENKELYCDINDALMLDKETFDKRLTSKNKRIKKKLLRFPHTLEYENHKVLEFFNKTLRKGVSLSITNYLMFANKLDLFYNFEQVDAVSLENLMMASAQVYEVEAKEFINKLIESCYEDDFESLIMMLSLNDNFDPNEFMDLILAKSKELNTPYIVIALKENPGFDFYPYVKGFIKSSPKYKVLPLFRELNAIRGLNLRPYIKDFAEAVSRPMVVQFIDATSGILNREELDKLITKVIKETNFNEYYNAPSQDKAKHYLQDTYFISELKSYGIELTPEHIAMLKEKHPDRAEKIERAVHREE